MTIHLRGIFFISAISALGMLLSPVTVHAQQFAEFIPKGYHLLDSASGDLNNDSYPDVVLALASDIEEDSTTYSRPLLLLMGRPGGTFLLKTRNDQVVLCRECGGLWGNPFEGLEIDGRNFSVFHYGGSRYRWNQTIVFRYDPKIDDFVLYKDYGVSYDNAKPDKIKKHQNYKKARKGRVLFKEYKNSLLEN